MVVPNPNICRYGSCSVSASVRILSLLLILLFSAYGGIVHNLSYFSFGNLWDRILWRPVLVILLLSDVVGYFVQRWRV